MKIKISKSEWDKLGKKAQLEPAGKIPNKSRIKHFKVGRNVSDEAILYSGTFGLPISNIDLSMLLHKENISGQGDLDKIIENQAYLLENAQNQILIFKISEKNPYLLKFVNLVDKFAHTFVDNNVFAYVDLVSYE